MWKAAGYSILLVLIVAIWFPAFAIFLCAVLLAFWFLLGFCGGVLAMEKGNTEDAIIGFSIALSTFLALLILARSIID